MKGFSIELTKIMRNRKGLLFIVLFFLVSFSVLILTDSPKNSAMEQYRSEYEWYLAPLSGQCTDQAATWLEQMAGDISKARRERSVLTEQYRDGKISDADFQQESAGLDAKLERQHGFEVIYQQYLYISENPDNRYFLQTNGWAGLLQTDTLDFALLLLLLLLVTPAFCSEYACQMDALILTSPEGRKSAVQKLAILLASAVLLSLTSSVLRYGFYAAKYGLPCGSYPLQSLAYFGESTKTLSLMGAFLWASMLQCFGCVYFSLLLLFLSVILKSYAPSLLTGAASMLIPYIALSKTALYRLALPLPFFLGTGFLLGNCYAEDALSGEQVAVFQEVGASELAAQLLVSVALCLLAIVIILRRNRNCWQSPHCRTLPAASLSVLVLLLAGCSASADADGQYHGSLPTEWENRYCSGYEILFDEQTRRYSLQSVESGETLDILRSPMFGAFGAEEMVKGLFCSDPYLYCLISRTESYVDRVGKYNSTYTVVSIVQVDLETFQENVIFEKVTDSVRSILGIEYETGDQWEFLQFCGDFFLDEQKIFFKVDDGLVAVDRKSQQISHLDISKTEK